MLIRVSIIILASQLITPVADTLPTFNIARNCSAESNSKAIKDKCMSDEEEAREALLPQWSTFGRSDRLTCMKETNLDGTPSYVELLTCLEMARDARKLPKQ